MSWLVMLRASISLTVTLASAFGMNNSLWLDAMIDWNNYCEHLFVRQQTPTSLFSRVASFGADARAASRRAQPPIER